VSYPLAGTTQGINMFKIIYNYSALADILYIYPNKRKKKSFDSKRDEILRNGLEAALSGSRGDGKSGRNNGNKKFDSPSKVT